MVSRIPNNTKIHIWDPSKYNQFKSNWSERVDRIPEISVIGSSPSDAIYLS